MGHIVNLHLQLAKEIGKIQLMVWCTGTPRWVIDDQ
jgi:hypothetical protein